MVSNKKLLLTELKRNTWVIAALSLAMLFMKPLMLILEYENNARFTTGVKLIVMMEQAIINLYASDMLLTYASAILLGLVGFSFVFSRSKIDMYHSIPVKRTRRFTVNYMTGLLIYTVLYALVTIITAIVAASYHFLTVDTAKNLILVFTGALVHFIYAYSVVIVAVMLTGNIVVCFAAIATFMFGYMGCTYVINYYMNTFFVTRKSYKDLGEAFWNKFPYLSPLTSDLIFHTKISGMIMEYYSTFFESRAQAFIYLIKVLVIAVIVLAAAFYLYQMRASEAAGKSVAFKLSQPFIRIPIVIIVGLTTGYMLLSIASKLNPKWLWIGAIIGVILSHCIIEIIFNLNFKAFFNNKIQLAASLAATLLIIFIFYGDVFHYDMYISDRAKIESAAVVFYDINNDMNWAEYFIDDESGHWGNKYCSKDDYVFKRCFEDDEMIDKVYEIAKIGVASVDDMKNEEIKRIGGNKYTMSKSLAYVNAVESNAIGYVDGPTSVFIADSGETTKAVGIFSEDEDGISNDKGDENGDAALSGSADYKAKLKKAQQYMNDNNIVVHDPIPYTIRTNFAVYYKLKNGKVVLRKYTAPLEHIEKAMSDIYSTSEFKKAQFNIFEVLDKNAAYKVELYDTIGEKQMVVEGDEMQQFMDVYLDELKGLSVEDLKTTPIGQVGPMIKMGLFDEVVSGYYIYPSFTKTLSFMKNKGVKMDFFTTDVDIDKIDSVTVYPYDIFVRNYELTEGDRESYENVPMKEAVYYMDNPEDRALMEKIIPYLEVSQYGYTNHIFIQYDGRYDMNVQLNPDYGVHKNWNCQTRKYNMPKALVDDLMIKMYEYQVENDIEYDDSFVESDPGEVIVPEPRDIGD